LQPERGLFGLIAGGDQPCDQVDQEVDGAAMTGMLESARNASSISLCWCVLATCAVSRTLRSPTQSA